MEFVTVLTVAAVLSAIAVPSAAGLRAAFGAQAAVGTLALVLREAQAGAQSSGLPVEVVVAPDGDYSVRRTALDGTAAVAARGSLHTRVGSNYPGGLVVFSGNGLPGLPGSASPRAGRFTIGSHAVVVQLGGCVRCL